MAEPQQPVGNHRRGWLPLAGTLLLLSVLGLAYVLSEEVRQFLHQGWSLLSSGDRQALADRIRGFGWWGPLAVITAMVLQMFLLVVPSVLLMVVAVLVYGPLWGGLLALVAVLSAAAVGYAIGAGLGPLTVDRVIGGSSRSRLSGYVDRYGAWAVFAVRLSPLLSNDAISLVGGLLRMGFLRFMLATLGGILPLTALIAYTGGRGYQALEWALGVLSVVTLLALVAYGIVRHRRDNRPER